MHIFLNWLILVISTSSSLRLEDFYDYSNATDLVDYSKHLDFNIKFPHWSDNDNMQLDIIKSGVIRFSGLNSANTLDILVMATSSPLARQNTVKYESKISNPNLNSNITRDLNFSFNSMHVVIVTWLNTAFYSNAFSTFQIIVASNGSDTYAILNLQKLSQATERLQYYPEVDLRYSYNGGSMFIRSDFLRATTGTSTRNEKTVDAATSQSNIHKDKPGLWVLPLNKDPTENNETLSSTKKPDTTPSGGLPVSDFSGIGLRGEFTFENLTINNITLLSEVNDEISIVLAKSTTDERYNQMDNGIKDWIYSVYSNDTNLTDVKVNIVGYRVGSLVVDYFVSLKDPSCTDGAVCAEKTKSRVKLITQGKFIVTGSISGSLNANPTFKSGLCENTGACDKNAYCIEYPERFSFGCTCKQGYYGFGFNGNCKKIIDTGMSFTPQLILVCVFSGFLAEVFLIFIVLRILRKNFINEHSYVNHKSRRNKFR